MRFWLPLFLLAPALLAQAPAGPHNYWHFQPPKAKQFFVGNPAPKPLVAPPAAVLKEPPKTCSIPLINALKARPGAKYHMKKIPAGPAGEEHFQISTVTPPAPPCDDGRR